MNGPSATYFEHVADLLAGTLRADRALRRHSLAYTGAGRGWPAMLALGAVRGEFHYALHAGRAARAPGAGMRLLGAGERPRDASRRPSAELTLRLGLAPALAARPADLAHPALELAAPEFLARPGQAGQLCLRQADGTTLTVGFPGPGRLRLADTDLTLFGHDGFATDYPGDTLAGWPMPALVAVLDSLAAWRRAGEPRHALPFRRPATHTGLGRLLDDLARGYVEIARLLASGAAEDGLAGPSALTLDSLEADARLFQDDTGELLDDAAELHRQRVDMLASLRWSATGPVITLAPRLSDIGVAGARSDTQSDPRLTHLLADFLATLRQGAAMDAVWAGLARGHDLDALDFQRLPEALRDWSRARLAAYLSDPAHDRAAILARMRHDDTDLVLLGETRAEPGQRLLLQARLGAPASARLVAIRARFGAWVTGDQNLAPRYFYRLFQTLHAWQSGLAAEAA